MRRLSEPIPAGAWTLVAVPIAIISIGLGVAHFDAFPEYREYVGKETVPQVLVRSGRTGRQLRLLDYQPLDGLKLEGFDNSLAPAEMPSTTSVLTEVKDIPLAVISVVVDSDDLLNRETGIIANYDKRGRSWERPAHASFFREGQLVWATGAGVRVHGGKSRSMTDKSFRLHFRKLYGVPGLDRGLVFEGIEGPMDSLVIHNDRRVRRSDSGDVSWHYINPMAYEVAAQIGGITVATEPVHFYLNGVYQGPYVLKERIRPDFLMSRFGHDDFFLSDTKSDDGSSPLIQGSQKELGELQQWPSKARKPLRLGDVADRFDIDSLTNWFIGVLYCATTDPFQGAVARDRSRPGSQWFWINWDMDHSFMDLYRQHQNPWEIDNFTGVSAIIGNMRPRPVLFDRLRTESQEYRRLFVERMTEVLNHELTSDFMEELISRYEATAEAFEVEDRSFFDTLRQFAEHRPAVLRDQMTTYFSAGPSYELLVRAVDSIDIKVDGRHVGEGYSGWYFAGTPAHIEIADTALAPEARWIVNGVAQEIGLKTLMLELSSDTVVEIVHTDRERSHAYPL